VDQQRLDVLAIDDNPDDLELLRRLLGRVPHWDLDFHGFDGSAPAVEYLSGAERSPDVVLLDFILGGETGHDAMLRLIEANYEGPIIIMTGHGDEELAVELIRGGASDYIPKSVLSSRVLERAISYSITKYTLGAKVEKQRKELQASYRELRRKSAEIQQMYHTLCHELKTPLTSMRQFLSLTLDGLGGPVTDDQREFLELSLESCDQMTVHVNDLVDVARIETGKFALAPTMVDVGELVRKLIPSLTPAAEEKGVTLSHRVADDVPPVRADETRLVQVVTNLVNNAVKFTPRDGRVRVRVQPDPDRADSVRVDVSDTGRGIPEESLCRIFDRLYQSRETDWSTVGGLGLGLHLCREIVRLHGGEIGVESEMGKGSTFRFSIPVEGPEIDEAAQAELQGAVV